MREFGGIFGKLNFYHAAKNFIFEDRKLKYKCIIHGNPLIIFLKKIQEDGPRPDLGLGFGGVRRDFLKIELLS